MAVSTAPKGHWRVFTSSHPNDPVAVAAELVIVLADAVARPLEVAMIVTFPSRKSRVIIAEEDVKFPSLERGKIGLKELRDV